MKFEANKEFMENLSLQEREGDLSLLTFSFSLSQSPCYKQALSNGTDNRPEDEFWQ